jgi:hypothetical protein
MWIMTIDTFDVSGRRVRRFFQIMDTMVANYIMPAELGKLGSQVGACHRAVMAAQTIVFRSGEVEQPFVSTGGMRPMTILTAILPDGSVLAVSQV